MNSVIITKETPVKSLIDKYPETEEILMGYGLHCAGCHFSELDTLEDGAMMHGLTDEDIELMIKDLNEVAKNDGQR